MAKVNFEFDESEDMVDIKEVVHRHTLMSALYDLKDLRRELYKGYKNNIVSVKDGKVLTQKDYDEANAKGEFISGSQSYIPVDDIINCLDDVLGDVYFLLD